MRERGFVRRFTKLGNLVDLAHGGVLINESEKKTSNDQNGHRLSKMPRRNIGSITKLGIVDIVRVFAADVLMGNEAGGTKVVWYGSGQR